MSVSEPVDSQQQLIKRLERRLDRERRARQEAEQIAERGLRSLYDANQELDRRILERTAELNEALAAAEAANKAKSVFLGQMSHQINTPLNGLLGMLELLAAELTDSQTEAWHASAMRSARRLDRLTTRLITYVELESADLEAQGEPRRLREVLSSVHDRWHTKCLRAGQLLSVELQSGADVLVAGPAELDLMLDELLSNTVDHAGPGAVTIAARPGVAADTVEFAVSDSGAGVETAQLERTHQLNASPDQTQIGDRQIHLGLALVDRIVTGLNGSWSVQADPSSSIVVTLPVVG